MRQLDGTTGRYNWMIQLDETTGRYNWMRQLHGDNLVGENSVGHLGGTNVRDNWIEPLDGTMDQETNNGQDNGTK